MAGLMIDSDNPDLLLEPRFNAIRIATYADLVTPAYLAHAGKRLTVLDRGLGDPHNVATVADVERGSLTVQQGVDLVRKWNEEHRNQPAIYHNRSNWSAVSAAGAGVSFAHWIATLDGTLVPGGYYMPAVQFAPESELGFHADMSLVWADNWHSFDEPEPALPIATLRSLTADALRSVSSLVAAVNRL